MIHLRGERTIFPALLNDFERALLNQLSTECGISMSAVVRTLILKEVASRQLGSGRNPLLSQGRDS